MLDRLLPELLLQVLDVRNFRDSSPSLTREDSERPHVDALCACTLVCKKTSSVARPELWREVSTIKSVPQYEGLVRLCALPRFASLAQLIRMLGSEHEPYTLLSRDPESRLDHLLPSLPNLQELRVVSHGFDAEADRLARLDRVLLGDNHWAVVDDKRLYGAAVVPVPIHWSYPRFRANDFRPPVKIFDIVLTSAPAGLHTFCFVLVCFQTLYVRVNVEDGIITCKLYQLDAPGQPPHGLFQRTVVRAQWPDDVSDPEAALPYPLRVWLVDLKVVCLDAGREPSAALGHPDSDAYPRVETIFLPRSLRDPPASTPPELHEQRAQFFEQCAAQHVRVDYLCSELRPDWPEWAKGLPVLEELVDR